MNLLSAFAAGLLFGIGLIISGMADPGKVLGFLDVAGRWDPSLAFVMAGAIGVGFAAFRLAGRRARTFVGGALPHEVRHQLLALHLEAVAVRGARVDRGLLRPLVVGRGGRVGEVDEPRLAVQPVSYTHLTLPTNREV